MFECYLSGPFPKLSWENSRLISVWVSGYVWGYSVHCHQNMRTPTLCRALSLQIRIPAFEDQFSCVCNFLLLSPFFIQFCWFEIHPTHPPPYTISLRCFLRVFFWVVWAETDWVGAMIRCVNRRFWKHESTSWLCGVRCQLITMPPSNIHFPQQLQVKYDTETVNCLITSKMFWKGEDFYRNVISFLCFPLTLVLRNFLSDWVTHKKK